MTNKKRLDKVQNMALPVIPGALLFRTSEERTLRLHASLPATCWPRHACNRPDQVSAEHVVQAFFVPYKKRGSSVPIVFVVVCSFQYLSGNDIWHISEGDFRLSCCARRFSLCIFFLGEIVNILWELTSDTRRERVRASRVVQAFFVVCENTGLLFQLFHGRVFVFEFVWEWYSPHDWRRLRLSYCGRRFSLCIFSWEKSWMFGENCACRRVLWVSCSKANRHPSHVCFLDYYG